MPPRHEGDDSINFLFDLHCAFGIVTSSRRLFSAARWKAGIQDTSFVLRRKKFRVGVEKDLGIRSLGMSWTDNAPGMREVCMSHPHQWRKTRPRKRTDSSQPPPPQGGLRRTAAQAPGSCTPTCCPCHQDHGHCGVTRFPVSRLCQHGGPGSAVSGKVAQHGAGQVLYAGTAQRGSPDPCWWSRSGRLDPPGGKPSMPPSHRQPGHHGGQERP